MRSHYKNRNMLKNQPFYSEEIKSFEKKNKKSSNISLLSELPFFYKKPKELTNKQLSEALPFLPKKPKKPKRLTKRQILENILPSYDRVGILRREHVHKHYAETYDVEITDSKSLDDSLFLAKRSIKDLFKDLFREKRGFKYNLGAGITLKRWNNATNTYDIETIHIKTKAITVKNQRFNLNSASEELKHRVDIWTGLGSGWIINKTEDINTDIVNYDSLTECSYILLPPELKNSMKGLINLKNKDNGCFKWCHIRFINPQNKDADRIKKQDKEIAK